MWTIGGKILDVYDDVGLKLLAGSPYLEKVGSLPMGDPSDLPDLEDRQFGVIFITKTGETVRKFPLNDMTNTVLSNVYFELTHDKMPPEAKVAAATQIRDASKLAGITVTPAVEKYAADVSVEGDHFVYLTKVQAQHPKTIDFFKQMSDEYVANREKYGRAEKIELAQAMAGIADQYGLEVHDDLKSFVIKDAVIDKEAFDAQCAYRKKLLQHHEEVAPLINELMDKQASFEPKETVKLLETFDRQFGLEEHWNRGLEPNLILQEKVAYHSIASPIGGSMNFSENEIKAWVAGNGELLKQMFGQEGAEKLQNDPMSVWSLPAASRDFLTARMEHAKDNTPVSAS